MTKYEAQVTIEVDLDLDDLDGINVAYQAVDEIMQRAWSTDEGRRWIDQTWHYSMSGVGCVTEIVEIPEELKP